MQEHLTESGPKILDALRRAHDASVVEFTYRKKNGDKSHRRLVVQTLGEEKVLGWDLDAKAVRSFTIAGITELLTASPPEIDLGELAEAVRDLDTLAKACEDAKTHRETNVAANRHCDGENFLIETARKLVGDLLVVEVETGEEPPL